MNKQFRNLIVIPNLFLIILLGATTGKVYFENYFIFCLLTIENLFTWNKSFPKKKEKDFRLLFIDFKSRLFYSFVLLINYLIGMYLWNLISFWTYFIYGIVFIIFKLIFINEGLNIVENLPVENSEIIFSDYDLWESNKTKLKGIIELSNNIELVSSISDLIDYSSFLRTEEAAELLKKAEKGNKETLNKILSQINKKL